MNPLTWAGGVSKTPPAPNRKPKERLDEFAHGSRRDQGKPSCSSKASPERFWENKFGGLRDA